MLQGCTGRSMPTPGGVSGCCLKGSKQKDARCVSIGYSLKGGTMRAEDYEAKVIVTVHPACTHPKDKREQLCTGTSCLVWWCPVCGSIKEEWENDWRSPEWGTLDKTDPLP